MATRISVSAQGLFGLDDPERLLAELEAATGLRWRRQEAAEDGTLSGGIAEILMIAVLSRGAEMTLEAAVAAVRETVGRWRRERLDPPRTSVDTAPVPDEAADAGQGAARGTAPDGAGD